VSQAPYSKANPYAADLTCDYAGFCRLWGYIGPHLWTYGHPPEYRKTAEFLAQGGFMTAALRGQHKAKVKQFLDDIVAVCHKHGLSLSHEDSHGSFLVVPLNELYIEWLREAQAPSEE